MEAPAMRSSPKSEIVARLQLAACEKLCLSCWFPCLESFLDEKLGHLASGWRCRLFFFKHMPLEP